MDLNNNQPINQQPQQPIPTPTPVVSNPIPAQPPVQPPASITYQSPQAPKGNSRSLLMLLLLLVLIAGLAGYVFFAKNRISNTQKTAGTNKSVVLPKVTVAPTAIPVDNLDIASPEADLQGIEQDVQGL